MRMYDYCDQKVCQGTLLCFYTYMYTHVQTHSHFNTSTRVGEMKRNKNKIKIKNWNNRTCTIHAQHCVGPKGKTTSET